MVDWTGFEWEELEEGDEVVDKNHRLIKHLRKNPISVIEGEQKQKYPHGTASGDPAGRFRYRKELLHMGKNVKQVFDKCGCKIEDTYSLSSVNCGSKPDDYDCFDRRIDNWWLWQINDYNPELGILYNKNDESYGYMPWEDFALLCDVDESRGDKCVMFYRRGRDYHTSDHVISFDEFREWYLRQGHSTASITDYSAYFDTLADDEEWFDED